MSKFHKKHQAGSGEGNPDKVRGFGQFVLTDEAIKRNYRLFSPSRRGQVVVTPLGEPVIDDNGSVVDIKPFLTPTPGASLGMPQADGGILGQPEVGQYESKSFVSLPVVSFLGSTLLPDKNSGKLTFIDDHPEGDIQAGEATCLQSLENVASQVLAENPQWEQARFYISGRSYGTALKGSEVKGIMTCLCWEHYNDNIKASQDSPVPGVIEMTTAAVRSFAELIFRPNQGYTYPDNMDDIQALSSREEQCKRFAHGDLCDPGGVPGVALHKSNPTVNNSPYVANLTQNRYQTSFQQSLDYFLSPEDIYNFLTFEETYKILLRYAGEPQWFSFLVECGKKIPRIAEIATSTQFISLQQRQQEDGVEDNSGSNYRPANTAMMPQQQYQQQYAPPPAGGGQMPATQPLQAAPPAAPVQQTAPQVQPQPQAQIQPPQTQAPQQQPPQPQQQPPQAPQPQQQPPQAPQPQGQTQAPQQAGGVMPGPDTVPPANLPADHPQSIADRTAAAKARLMELGQQGNPNGGTEGQQ